MSIVSEIQTLPLGVVEVVVVIPGEVPKEIRDEVLLLKANEEAVSENYVRLWWD